tara:strand:- start:11813 stop:12961 length:1149 start_codon:yes stop_codon:yes gene_type:complete
MEENNNTAQAEETNTPSWSFVTEEEVAASMSQSQEQPSAEPVVEPTVDTTEEPTVDTNETVTQDAVQEPTLEQENRFNVTTDDFQSEDVTEDNGFSNEELESSVLSYLSERLGRDFNSFDDLNATQQQGGLDERISAIASFVEETGRDPEDWFMYQRLNPSEMDDLTAVQVQMALDYPNLSQTEISTLLNSKYKVDEDMHTEEEISLSKLQLKIDATSARQNVDKFRTQYKAPEVNRTQEPESLFDDEWYGQMKQELDSLEGIDFDLGNGNKFTLGLSDNYKNQLAEKNSHLDEYFDPYVHEDGSWDFDKLNMHRAVVDNIEMIVKSVYQQGMSDGQRGIVDKAANVNTKSPGQGGFPEQSNPLSEQLRQALGGGDTMTFKL